jgi:hypothetical protein
MAITSREAHRQRQRRIIGDYGYLGVEAASVKMTAAKK